MNDNNNEMPDDVLDSGWLKFWISFSCVCLVLSIFLPDVHMLKNRYALTWFWDANTIKSPGYMGAVWVYLLLGLSLLLLVCRSLFEGKRLAVVALGLLSLTSYLLMATALTPKIPGVWSGIALEVLICIIGASGLILAGTHLQKVLLKRTYPRVMLLCGGVLLFIALFLPAYMTGSNTVGQSLITGLFSTAVWSGSSLYSSIAILILLVTTILAIISIRFDTRQLLSIFMRLVFLAIPVVMFFYFYSPITDAGLIATIGFEAVQQTLWVYGFLMVPAAVASVIEWNTRFD